MSIFCQQYFCFLRFDLAKTTVKNVLEVVINGDDCDGTLLIEVHIFIVLLYFNSILTFCIVRGNTVVSQIRENCYVVVRRLQ